jgi:hypothetical protein
MLLVETLVANESKALGDIIGEFRCPQKDVKSLLKTFIVGGFVAIGLKG